MRMIRRRLRALSSASRDPQLRPPIEYFRTDEILRHSDERGARAIGPFAIAPDTPQHGQADGRGIGPCRAVEIVRTF